MGPYRSVVERDRAAPTARRRAIARDLLVPFAALWLLSLMRVVSVIARGQAVGGIDTLAILALVVLPWLVLERRSS